MHVSKLVPGDRVRIRKGFEDFDGRAWAGGEELVYAHQSYYFYDGGYTLIFDKGTMRLAELSEENGRVIRNEGEEYFELLGNERG